MPARPITVKQLKSRTSAERATKVVVYARVSSKEQREEGYSIEAQLRLLREYALRQGFVIAEEFIDVESASKTGRTGFNAMLVYLRKYPACRVVLVEKTDRLYRNLKDYATLDVKDWGLSIHLVKEGEILSPDSKSNQLFVHEIKVCVARNYTRNLGEETIKGMTEKARSGMYPSFAPIGYRNADGESGKRVIVPDPETAPIIVNIFERFATGSYSVKALVKELNAEGVRPRGRRLHTSLLHYILRRRLYMGDFDFDGETYTGTYLPLISRELWQRVQELLDARADSNTRRVKHDFAYTGLVQCGHCGCLLVGELKKGKYVYYHCTGNRGKCPEPYTRQESLEARFASILKELVIPEAVLDWLAEAVIASDRTEQAARGHTIKQLQTRVDQIQNRIETMYLDRLDGRITAELYDKQAATFRAEQDGLRRKIQEARRATPAAVHEAIDMLHVTSRASELFGQQPPMEQRRLLNIMVQKASWRDSELQTTLFEPFEILRHSNHVTISKENAKIGSGLDLKVWLLR